MSDQAIQVNDLVKKYGPVLAVDRINFSVAPGELVGFLGPNGAGKSTTMRILTTFMPATSGIARICGHDVMENPMGVRESIGYLPESVPLYPEMRVEEYLTYRAKLKGVDRKIRRARLDQCLEKCRVNEVRRRLLGTLSKGYRQRIGLADALLADPKVLILDEPTSGLDPIQIRETLSTIKSLAGTHTVLLSTHILSEVEAICDRVVIINRGNIRWDGKLSTLSNELPTLVMDLAGPRGDIDEWFKKVAGNRTASVSEGDDGAFRCELQQAPGDAGDTLRESLAKQAVERGFGLRRLDIRRKNLETLYTEVVLRRSAS